VVLAASHEEGLRAPRAGDPALEVVWHDLECGAYRADLPLWRELAEQAQTGARSAPILDIGAGAGRVALDLARAGHPVTALDLDPDLLNALRARATGMHVQTVCADARTFELDRRDFALCLAPMQTVQLLGGSAPRLAFLRRARAHLRPGGLLACAIVTELEPFDCAAGDLGPSPEVAHGDGTHYVSRATRVHVGRRSIRIERERRILPAEHATASGRPAQEHNVVELDRLSASQLRRDGLEADMTAAGTRSIAATEDHVGSVVVILRV
jgi:SAM-dependent methyltransferase